VFEGCLDGGKINLKIGNMYKINDKVRVSGDNDNESYDSFRGKTLIITHIATNVNDHPGYDESMEGMQLLSFNDEDGNGISCSLYEYEIESL